MASIARMAALHSALWGFDRYYRMAWYAAPVSLAVLIAGWICIDKQGAPAAAAGNWAKPVAGAPNFPVRRSPILATWPEKLQNDVMTCFSNAANMTTLQPLIDACTHLIDSLQINDGQMATAYNQRGFLQRLTQPDRAIADYESALKVQPNMPAALTNRAIIYLTRNRNDDAMADLNKAIELFPPAQAGFARYLRGYDYFRQKKYDLAMEDLNESVKHIPNSPEPYLARGEVEHAEQQWDAALRDFDQYSRLAPRSPRGLIGKALVLEATGHIPEALSAVDAAITIEPANQGALTTRDRLRAKQAVAPQQPKQDGKD